MEIVLVRHGSASWDADTDIERSLTAQGEIEAQSASHWLRQDNWIPDELWLSPYRRAQQTAAILNRDWQLRRRLKSSLSPDAALSELEAMLATFQGQRLLMVGHNPLLSNAIASWHGGSPETYWGMQTASMALLEGELIAPSCVTLKWLRHYPNYDHNGL